MRISRGNLNINDTDPTVFNVTSFETMVPSSYYTTETQSTFNPTHSPTLSIDDYPTDLEIEGYGSTGHYWYEGEQSNGRRLYRNTERSKLIYWAWNIWYIGPNFATYFSRCWSYNIFECKNDFMVKYCVSGTHSDDVYFVNGTYNGRWIFQALNSDRYIYYHLDEAVWKITDKQRNNAYAICDNQNIFKCNTGFHFGTCQTRAPTMDPTVSPSTYSPTLPSGMIYNDLALFTLGKC